MADDPYVSFASSLKQQISGHTQQMMLGTGAELGTITATGLKLDHFKHEIQDYYVADFNVTLAMPAYTQKGKIKVDADHPDSEELGSGTGKMDYEVEAAEIPKVGMSLAKGLVAGDRVVVLQLNGGQDAVVLCKVVSAGG